MTFLTLYAQTNMSTPNHESYYKLHPEPVLGGETQPLLNASCWVRGLTSDYLPAMSHYLTPNIDFKCFFTSPNSCTLVYCCSFQNYKSKYFMLD